MVKKVKRNHPENKQLNNLIKVLRPKVFITDSSNFKRLVQELTGNGNMMMPSPSLAQKPVTQQQALNENYVPVLIDIDEAISSFDELCNNLAFSAEGGLLTEAHNEQIQLINDTTFDLSTMDWLTCQDLESWLLDTDQPFNGFAQNQEVGVND